MQQTSLQRGSPRSRLEKNVTRINQMLVREKALSNEEWIELIEARVDSIKYHLRAFTLPDLGSVCLFLRGTDRTLKDYDIPVRGEKFSLKTQGIFNMRSGREQGPTDPPNASPDTCHNGSIRFWGLTRSCEWIIVKVYYVGVPCEEIGYWKKPIKVEVENVGLETLIVEWKVQPYSIWDTLYLEVDDWTQRHNELLNRLDKIQDEMKAERGILDKIVRNSRSRN